MSELKPTPRRRRADAQRSIVAVLDAAVRLLAEKPGASMGDIAAAAGVSRQTLYAHFPSREALLDAVLDRLTAEVVAAIDSDPPEGGSATDALLRFLGAGWRTFGRYVALFQDAAAVSGAADDARHAPIRDRLLRLIRRGQDAGEFDRRLSPDWLLAAVIGLAHTAGAEVSAGRMTVDEATEAVRRSTLRVLGVEEPPMDRGAPG